MQIQFFQGCLLDLRRVVLRHTGGVKRARYQPDGDAGEDAACSPRPLRGRGMGDPLRGEAVQAVPRAVMRHLSPQAQIDDHAHLRESHRRLCNVRGQENVADVVGRLVEGLLLFVHGDGAVEDEYPVLARVAALVDEASRRLLLEGALQDGQHIEDLGDLADAGQEDQHALATAAQDADEVQDQKLEALLELRPRVAAGAAAAGATCGSTLRIDAPELTLRALRDRGGQVRDARGLRGR
mmetsp:Transcript_1362/g.5485  ORF Transcript_1362/g.5485 Transcript_1362/m.5485 type:complete len:239 (-) Transcript_1362:1414-2130(-)